LQQASTAAAKPLPEDFSRLLLFFTTGKAVQARLAEQGVRDYGDLYQGAHALIRRLGRLDRRTLRLRVEQP
jgi:hypothetical protein